MSATMIYPRNGAPVSTVFIAFGPLNGSTSVKGVLTPTRNGLFNINHARAYYEGGTHWWLAFIGALEGESYNLKVLDNSDSEVGTATGLIVGAPGVNINSPQADTTVPTSFGCYGASTAANSTLTTMEVRNSAHTVNGSIFYQQVTQGNLFFGIAFNNVPPSNGDLYTLTVEHANGVVGQKGNLNVA